MADDKNPTKLLPECMFYPNAYKVQEDEKGFRLPWDPMRVTELTEIGAKRNLCPYKAQQQRATRADVIFCPYNYLIDKDIRQSLGLDLTDKIILIDEAHNTGKTAEDSVSCKISTEDFDPVRAALLDL
jgi:fanconi anemia group J protein